MVDALLETTRRAWFAQGIAAASSLGLDIALALAPLPYLTGAQRAARQGSVWGHVVARLHALQDGGAEPEALRSLLVTHGCRFRRPFGFWRRPR